MIFSKVTLAAAIAFSSILGAMAQPIHQHNVHKREANAEPDVVVVVKHIVDTNGNVITVYTSQATPETTAAAVAPVASSSTVIVDTTAVATSAPAVVSSAPAVSSSAVVSSAAVSSAHSSSAVASSAAPASTSSSSSSSSGSFNGGAKGVVYSPYKVGGCKTAQEVKSDIAKLSGFEVIRIYGVDCDQVSTVKAALAPGQKIFLGIFDVANLQSGLSTLISAINGDWSIVHTVSIGNELVNNGQASVSQIAGYVSAARPILSAAGYTGPVVSVDTFIAVINNPGLCDISDYMAVNAHAYFDGQIDSAGAGKWTLEQIQRVWTACGGKKDVFITEAGWPHSGESNGKANASPADQAAALSSIKSATGSSCILFTGFDDLWKAPGLYSIEQSFGFVQ